MNLVLSHQARTVAAEATDDDLITAIKTRRAGALREIHWRYAGLVYHLALRILNNAEEAEDMTQEIFLTLWQQCRYDASRGSLKGFLVMMTRSRAIDRVRSQKSRHRRLQRLRTAIAHPTENTPLEQAAKGEATQQIRNALSSLSQAERQVLETAYYEGLSQSQIANHLGIPIGTVKTLSRQGLKKLRCALNNSTE